MDVQFLPETEKQRWDTYVLSHPDSIAWQVFGWHSVVAKHYPVRFYPIAAVEGGAIRGVLPLSYLETGKGRGKLLSVPYAVAGGMLADSDEVRLALLQEAVALSKQHGNCTIAFKQYKRAIPAELKTDANYYNRELDIRVPLDRIWDGFSDTNKRSIESAKGTKPTLDYPSAETDAFYEMLLRHMHRRGTPCPGKRWIEDLLAFDMYSVALLKVGGRVVAGTLAKEYKKTVSFPFSCAKDDSIASRDAVYALYWHLIGHYAQKGFEVVHSGRIPNTDETDPYRLGWGGTKHPYFYQYYPPGEGQTEFKTKRGAKRRLIEACWKRMPLALARWAGPRIVARYP